MRLISEKLNIPRNFFFIASPAANFSVKLASLGGMRSCGGGGGGDGACADCVAGCRLITH